MFSLAAFEIAGVFRIADPGTLIAVLRDTAAADAAYYAVRMVHPPIVVGPTAFRCLGPYDTPDEAATHLADVPAIPPDEMPPPAPPTMPG